MDLEIYDRQKRLDLRVPEVASVVGCGGTGFWVAVGLAMSGVKELKVFDPDRIEISNLNRLPLSDKYVGEAKVDALAEFLSGIRPDVLVKKVQGKVDEELLGVLEGTVFCCTDTIESQQLIYHYCRARSLPYFRVGYDGTALNVSRAYPLVIDDTPPPNGYEVTPSWVVPACVAGMLGVASALYSEITLMDDIGTLTHSNFKILPIKMQERITCKYLENGEVSEDVHEALTLIDYDYCPDCNRRDCDTCNICDDCDRGVCWDCDREDVGSYNRGREDGYEEGYDRCLSDIGEAIEALDRGRWAPIESLDLKSDTIRIIKRWYEVYKQGGSDESR